MGSSADWALTVEALSDVAFCVTVDLPGHGRSTGLPSHLYTMEGATQAVADVLDEVGIDRGSLVGYSMGGRVALYFSLFYADRVRRLVLESASPGLQTKDARSRRRALDAERAERIRADLGAFLEEWYRQPLFESLQRHGLVDEMVDRRSTNDPDELARALTGLGPGHQPSLWERLGEIEVPTLVMTGGLDEKYEDVTERTARVIGTADRVLVPEAGHNVHAERPQAFLAQLSHFLAQA